MEEGLTENKTNIVITPKHSLLFKLRYIADEHPKTDEEMLAKLNAAGLGVASPQELYQIGKELDRHIDTSLNHHVTPERIRDFCPECLTLSVRHDEELDQFFCSTCGTVISDLWTPDQSIPYDQTYKPSSNLSTSGGNGTSLDAKTYYTLAKGNGLIHKKTNGSNYLSLNSFTRKYPSLVAHLTSEGYVCCGDTVYVLEEGADQKVYLTLLSDIGGDAVKRVLSGKSYTKKDFVTTCHMNDLPMRKMKVRMLAGSGVPELDQKLKEGTNLIVKFGLNQNYTFGNTLGLYIHRSYHYIKDFKSKVPTRCIPATAFIYTLCVSNKWQHIEASMSTAFQEAFPSLAAELEQKCVFRESTGQSLLDGYSREVVANFDEALFKSLGEMNAYFRCIKNKIEKQPLKGEQPFSALPSS